MNDFMKRVERVKAALVGRQPSKVTLAYADGSRRSVPILEAVEEVRFLVDGEFRRNPLPADGKE